MTSKQHIQFTVITSCAVYITMNSTVSGMEMPMVFGATAIIGSLFPDIDTGTSLMGRCFPKLSRKISELGNRGDNFKDYSALATTFNVGLKGSYGVDYSDENQTDNCHRKFMHDCLLWGLVALISCILFPVTSGFWFGYLGHLFLDAFTKKRYSFWLFFKKEYPYSLISERFKGLK